MRSAPDTSFLVSHPAHALSREPVHGTGSLELLPGYPAVSLAADANELAVLSTMLGRTEPLTLPRICVLTALGPLEVQAALNSLRQSGLVLRPNTVVESYVAPYR
jgi:hypothetical protein